MNTSGARQGLVELIEQCSENEADQVVVRRVINALAPALRAYEIDLLSAVTSEITTQIAPSVVALNMVAGEPQLHVVAAPADAPASQHHHDVKDDSGDITGGDSDTGNKATARISLRLPERLKDKVDAAAASNNTSVNTWVVEALTAAVRRAGRSPRETGNSSRLTGWVK